jgi:CheY-like chemotaxis protein
MGRKILLVDANVFNRKFIRELLSTTGLEIIEARSCQQGVEMAISQHPGLILLAAGMPCLNAIETFAVLRQFPSTSMIPVLSVSSQAEEDGGSSYAETAKLFNRPVPIQALVDKIRPYVNAARSMVNATMI